jgi:hypothetical protein
MGARISRPSDILRRNDEVRAAALRVNNSSVDEVHGIDLTNDGNGLSKRGTNE